MSNYQEYILDLTLERYLLGELDQPTSDIITDAATEIALCFAQIFIIELAYHIGYAKSLLIDRMCETTYKKTKKLVKINLIKRLLEWGEQ